MTIVAVASPPGGAARGVVRLSGPRALDLARSLAPGAALDGGLRRVPASLALAGWPPIEAALWVFRAPRSYTGEDACELHVPGSPPLLRAIVRALEAQGARPAAPGEFTRRAFLNGRLDLAQAEAVLALTSAEAEGEARAAVRALAGGLGRAIDAAKSEVLAALAHVEATIDFPEDDLPGLAPAAAIADQVERAHADLRTLDRRSLRRRVAGTEPTVVIAGLANAGKSTLLNALAGREAALVSPVAGTTRDPVSVVATIGVPVRLVDTAGEMSASSGVEREAQARTAEAALGADLVLYVFDASEEDPGRAKARLPERGLLVAAKADLVPDRRASLEGQVDALVSARTGSGLPALRALVARALEVRELQPDLVQTERQARLVASARDALEASWLLLRSEEPARLELSAVDLRAALASLGELTGAVATDDLLDRIFGEFCIGK